VRPARRHRQTVDWRWPGAIFLLAVLVRLIVLYQSRHDPFFASPIIDSATYDRMAWDYARGRPLWDGAFWQPPLYPWLLGLFYKLAGHALLGTRIVQAIVGALSCVLLYAIGRRAFDRRVAAGAALTMAVYGPLVYFDGEILPPCVYLALTLVALLVTLVAEAQSGRRWWFLAGALIGLAALARPDVLVFAGAVGLWTLFAPGDHPRSRAIRAACLAAGIVIPISITTVRNWRAEHDLVPISGNGGLNFYLGNNPEADRTVAVRPGFEWTRIVNEPFLTAGIERTSERSAYFFRKGMAFITAEPATACRLYARKTALYWNSFEIGRNRDLYAAREQSSLVAALLWRRGKFGFPFGLLAPLAIAGLATVAWTRPRTLLALFILSFTVSGVLFFVAARYRVPMIPVLALFGAAFVVRAVTWANERRWRPLAVSLLLVAAAFAAVNRGYEPIDRLYRGERDRYLAIQLLDRGQRGAAEAAYRRALALDPKFAEAHAELGQLLADENRHREALDHFGRANAICPRSEETSYLLAGGKAAVGDTAEAEAAFRQAIALAPYAPAYRDLGVLYLAQGKLDDAASFLQRAAELARDDLDTWYKLAQCRVMQAKYAEAYAALEKALRLAPGDREIQEKLQALSAILRSAAAP
jgi:4-amino-4-deoxy-L-arabinose transferase-like glycosyltransferase/Tfp pilus assembly protein PilF